MDAESLFICVYLVDRVIVAALLANSVKAFTIVEYHGRADEQAGFCPNKVVYLEFTRDDMVEEKRRMTMNGSKGTLAPAGRHSLIAIWVAMGNGPRVGPLYPREFIERQHIGIARASGHLPLTVDKTYEIEYCDLIHVAAMAVSSHFSADR